MQEGRSRPFVGRTSELARLVGLLEEAAVGRGCLVVVNGEAGIGKTALGLELTGLASGRGLRAAWAGCGESSTWPGFWPWQQLMEQLGASVRAVSSSGSAPDLARAELFATVVEILRARAQLEPCVLVIDDLQWADAGTVELLRYVAPTLRSMALLMVVTIRSGTDGAAALVAALGRLGQGFPIDGLSVAEVQDLVTYVVDVDPGSAVAGALHHATVGNPLFVTELARELQRADALESFVLDDTFPVPPTVRAVLDERVARVSAGCRELLEFGAVIGQSFPLALVAAACEREVADLVVVSDEAHRARIVTTDGPTTLTFTHPLLRSVVNDDMGLARRADLHRRVAEAIERRPAPRTIAELAALSHHFLMAAPTGTAAKAASYCAIAAHHAMDALAYEEATVLFDRALTANDLDPSGTGRGALLLGAAEASAAAGDIGRARSMYLAAADSARATGRSDELAHAALGLAGVGFEVPLFDDEQIALLDEALAAVNDEHAVLRSRVAARLSVALSLAGMEERRTALAANAVQLAQATNDDVATAAALAARCDARAGPDHVHQRIQDAGVIVTIGQRSRDHGTELLGRRLRLLASLEAGDLPAFDREVHEFQQLTDRLRQPRYEWYPRLWRATRAAMQGRLDEQARLADEAEAMGRAAASLNVEILLLAHRHFVWIETGDIDTYLVETERLAPPGSWEELGIQMLPLAIMRPLFAGRPEQARAALDRSAAALQHAPRDSEWLTLLAQVSDLCWKLGGHELVPWLYQTLRPYADLWTVDGIAAYAHGPVHRHLGILAALTADYDLAREHFDAALAGTRAAGADLLAARTLFDRGVALNEHDTLHAARSAYHELGVDRVVTQIDQLLADKPTAPPAPNSLRCEGDIWALRFAGTECRVRDSKGMRDLSVLIAACGREIAAVDLAAPSGVGTEGHLGDTVDATARAAYKARLVELETDLNEADKTGDIERSSRLLVERDALVEQLTSAYGLGGRPRHARDPAERARSAVTARIRDAIRRIDAVHPELGRHLARAVRTGTFCSYDPDSPMHWQNTTP